MKEQFEVQAKDTESDEAYRVVFYATSPEAALHGLVDVAENVAEIFTGAMNEMWGEDEPEQE